MFDSQLVYQPYTTIIYHFVGQLQVIPRQLCDNAGFDATDALNKLRQQHALPSGLFLSVLVVTGATL